MIEQVNKLLKSSVTAKILKSQLNSVNNFANQIVERESQMSVLQTVLLVVRKSTLLKNSAVNRFIAQ